jgi:Glycosyl hydrolases family 18
METYNALAMVTKAGVSSDKIMVGIASYGRQFKMTDPNCATKDCTYTGPKATGTPGRCTNESAYISNAEIKEIIAKNPSAKVVNTGGSSKYMTYDGNWVSYMDDNDKAVRTTMWKSLNFGGVVEWAIDLNTFEYDNGPNVAKARKARKGGLQVFKGMRGDDISAADQSGSMGNLCGEDDSWREVTCSNPGIDRYNLEPWNKWELVKCDAAWCSAMEFWTSLRDSNKNQSSFASEVMAGHFKGPGEFNCQVLNDQGITSCLSPQQCEDKTRSSAAAMQLIGASLHSINSVSDKMQYNILRVPLDD